MISDRVLKILFGTSCEKMDYATTKFDVLGSIAQLEFLYEVVSIKSVSYAQGPF